LTIAALNDYRHRGRLMLYIMTGFGTMLLLFSLSSWPIVSGALLLGVGAGQTGYMAMNTTLLQTHASDEMRGRVMSVFFLNRGLVPLGTIGAGFAAEFIGAQWTVAIMASAVILLAVLTIARVPQVREVE
jgi:MFS family permease